MKGWKYVLLSAVMVVSITTTLMAQGPALVEYETQARKDSLAKVEKIVDADNLSELKSERNDTKAKAKEAQRVERNASDAAREARIAYQTERKAQKARQKADRQAKKAARAKIVSGKD
jgi:hypothetical protein